MAKRKQDLTPEFDLEKIAEKYDKKARKDNTLNMRISSRDLELIKQAAEAKGFKKYQQWVEQVLTDAIEEALNMNPEE